MAGSVPVAPRATEFTIMDLGLAPAMRCSGKLQIATAAGDHASTEGRSNALMDQLLGTNFGGLQGDGWYLNLNFK